MLGLSFFEVSYGPRNFFYGHSLTLDLATGKPVKLSELFTSGTPYLDIIGTASRPLVIEQFKEAGIDERQLCEECLKPLPLTTRFVNWLITPNGLSLTFFPNYLSIAQGNEIEIVIPWSSLPHLNQDRVDALLKGSSKH
jgi:hypothetical protein